MDGIALAGFCKKYCGKKKMLVLIVLAAYILNPFCLIRIMDIKRIIRRLRIIRIMNNNTKK